MTRPLRRAGLSARMKLTVVMSLLVVCTGAVLVALVYVFLLRYVPDVSLNTLRGDFAPSRRDLAAAFLPRALWALAALVVFSAFGTWLLAGRLLRPMHKIQATSLKVAAGELSSRVELPGARNEFSDVADAMDQMLDRIQDQVQQQRRFAANASHELRTPLAALRATLDVGPQGADGVRDFSNRLGNITAKAERTVQALLTLSRAEAQVLAMKDTDLSVLVEDVVEDQLPQALAAGSEIGTRLPDALAVRADAELLEHALSNLLRNAIAYGHGGISISGERIGATVQITVENAGAVLGEVQLRQMVEPFQRLDRLGSIDAAGVGLGLSIVDAVARAHGGELLLAGRPGGGLRATLRLPAK
ncbi:HAMP domain-containing sensor histidine kinase [Glutamicibacter sp.]|uniref:sensor histidine kinase n=1 Tax=Glutamicibacter sp. TaxID=1931995 RepID=UPI0028BE39D2|nr:HAMP domain-containing sensor histidine kinase [Glutamicibacter sp.]